jgi:thiol-disulfide isomerase/thioredoxin
MKRFLHILALPAVFALAFQAAAAAPAPIAVGKPAPAFTYHLLNGKTLSPAQLRGHKYILWVMGTWCPSCQAGSQIAAQHIADLQRKQVMLVEMEAYNNLGGNGPSLASVKSGIGRAADARNWYWGVLNEQQTATIDPKSAMDVFYLVDASGKVVAQSMAPGAHWAQIQAFVNGRS